MLDVLVRAGLYGPAALSDVILVTILVAFTFAVAGNSEVNVAGLPFILVHCVLAHASRISFSSVG